MIGWYQSKMHFHYIHAIPNHIRLLVHSTRSLHRLQDLLHSDTCDRNLTPRIAPMGDNYESHLFFGSQSDARKSGAD